jgi:hypothetical protein
MADDVEIEMDPMDLSRPTPTADADRARARDLRDRVLAKARSDAALIGLDDSLTEEWVAAKAQLEKAEEALAMRARDATTLVNRRDDRLARAAEAEAKGDHAAAAELREGAALADAQYQGYVTTVAVEHARVEALRQDVGRLDAWSEAASERAVRSTELLGIAEREIDDLEDRAERLTRAELHDRTAALYVDEAESLEATGHAAEAQALWDRATDEMAKASAARAEAATIEVDEAAFEAADLGPSSPATEPVAPAEDSEIEMPPEVLGPPEVPSPVEEPAASMDDFADADAGSVAATDDLGFDGGDPTFEG